MPGKPFRTRVRWAVDFGIYPPLKPDEPTAQADDLVAVITRKEGPGSMTEYVATSPEKGIPDTSKSTVLSIAATNSAKRALSLDMGQPKGPSSVEEVSHPPLSAMSEACCHKLVSL